MTLNRLSYNISAKAPTHGLNPLDSYTIWIKMSTKCTFDGSSAISMNETNEKKKDV